MDFNKSKTQANLLTAISGEALARTKYSFFAQIAKNEGFEQIANIFNLTALNEKAHAKIWFNFLKENKTPTTLQCLKDAASGENHEWSTMYAEFSKTAKDEGFTEIANVMNLIANVEKEHETRFLNFAKDIENNKVFKKDNEIAWICRNCGHVHFADKAPEICPACKHPQAYFEVKI